ncbi:hypothetical protein [Xanthomonas cannabis]|uniref:hypothetical protein n=1 Tax=Xanthomonas cannabis TaxID=1885674 RepID=UPI001F2EAF1B|nr:hypothetical protein [Xanthomonas cannabis]
MERWIERTPPNGAVWSIPSSCRARKTKSGRNRALEEAQCDWANVFVGSGGGAMAYGAEISGVDPGLQQWWRIIRAGDGTIRSGGIKALCMSAGPGIKSAQKQAADDEVPSGTVDGVRSGGARG